MRTLTSKLVAVVAIVGLLLVPGLPAYAAGESQPDPAISPASESTSQTNDTGVAIMILSAPTKGEGYSAGEEITVSLRFESALNTTVNIVGSSTTIAGPENCNWNNFPPAPRGRYNCNTQSQNFQSWPTYTVTSEDEERGWATLDFTFTAQALDNSSSQAVTVKKTVRVYKPGESEAIPEDPYKTVTLARAGDDNYVCHRIPALAKVEGRLIAAWDGRPNNCADAPNPNSIIMRYSDDDGETWSEYSTIAQGHVGADKYGYSDPSFIVDEETGTIFAFFVRSFDAGIVQSVPGFDPLNRNIIHTVYVKSEDKGETWSEPVVVTEEISQGQDQHARFAASGRGIQLKYGQHKGRLIQQYTVVNGGSWSVGRHQAASLYSDDHGQTWQVGQPVGGTIGEQMDENKVVELSDGSVLLSSRRYESSALYGRHYAISTDGGHSYVVDKSNNRRLKDPRNNASIIRAFPDAPQNSERAKVLLSSHANSDTARVDGMVSVSYDDGKTWSDTQLFKSGSMQYSTMEPLGDGKYGILFEGESSEILYRTVDLAWLGLDKALPLLPDVEKAEQDLADKQAELDKAQGDLEDSKAELAKTEAEKEQAEKAHQEAENALAQAQEELAQLKAELEKVKADNAANAEELAQAQQATDEAGKKIDQLEKDKAELAEKLAQAQEEAQAAKDAQAQAEAEAEKLKAEKAELEKKLADAQNKPQVEIPLIPLTPAQPSEKPSEDGSQPKIMMPAGDIVQGGTYTFTGSGFTPGETFKVTVHSVVVDLGAVTANEQGEFTLTWTVPADFAPGQHTVNITGAKIAVRATFDVMEKKVPQDGDTPTPQQPQVVPEVQHDKHVLAKTGVGLGVAGVAMLSLLALGGALSVTSRRRTNS
ncbi:exo-alpha-sialidase [Arcanobacterium phocisimile]|uniref:exo-alpha-sialidase n=1 Tax=Arcanobacterium phocisimile TaxID=1302235 RepID=A0ABX7IG69_9ACTO|nr:sialidase family protein [Arcanobacterium phocisimile]QRV02104.1 exo-alpha-sialidase [Arcanobacterium phocisimile]